MTLQWTLCPCCGDPTPATREWDGDLWVYSAECPCDGSAFTLTQSQVFENQSAAIQANKRE